MIERNPQQASRRESDLIVVGGGVYGICLALEAVRHGLRPLLLERDDFGGATSWNSLRIVHGGLRYLQRLDLHRFRESVAERSWFLRWFPDAVEPLPCLMPLYGQGLRRPAVLRLALGCNDRLARRWAPDRTLPPGRVLDGDETIARFENVERRGLRGAALWYDALMARPRRLVIEMLRWACLHGAMALNYAEASQLLMQDGRVTGVLAVDRCSGTAHEFHAPRVVNAAGPWCRELAEAWDREIEELFRPSLAFNLLLNVPPPSSLALAVAPKRGQPTYFLVPRHERVLAGTVHAACAEPTTDARPTEQQIRYFLDELNEAVPGWRLRLRDVQQVHAGLLPARRTGSDCLAIRESIHDHAKQGGPRGLWSVSGVKFTTARLVAEKTIRRAFGNEVSATPYEEFARPAANGWPTLSGVRSQWRDDPAEMRATLQRLADDESVQFVDDLLLRRTDWASSRSEARRLAAELREWMPWLPAACTHDDTNATAGAARSRTVRTRSTPIPLRAANEPGRPTGRPGNPR